MKVKSTEFRVRPREKVLLKDFPTRLKLFF